MTEYMEQFQTMIQGFSSVQIAIVVVLALVFSFLPTLLGLIRNRRHIGKIFLLNLPAAFTISGWLLLCGLVLIRFDSFADLKARFLNRRKKGDAPALAE